MKSSTNLKTCKLSQLYSTSSTHESCVGSAMVIPSSTINSLSIFGGKRFTRKRDGSTDSLKKGNLQPFKSNNLNITVRESSQSSITKVQETAKVCKIIKSNSYNKQADSTPSLKNSSAVQSIQIERCTEDKKSIEKSFHKTERYSFQQQRTDLLRTQQKRSRQQISYATPTRQRLTIKQSSQNQQSKFNLYSYPTAQTQREKGIKNDKQGSSEIKILQNQILILQDENSRLKKQVTQLTLERDQDRKKMSQTIKKLQELQVKTKSIKSQQKQFITKIKCEIESIVLEVSKNLGNQALFDKSSSSSAIIKPFSDKTSKNSSKNMEISIQNFIEEILAPAKQTINQNMKKFMEMFQSSKVCLNKMEIKQNIMMRGSLQLQNSKNQNRVLNQKLASQKNRALKYKEMYEKIKKQVIEPSKGKDKGLKISSQKLLGSNLKSNRFPIDDDCSFSLSQVSDDEKPRPTQKPRRAQS